MDAHKGQNLEDMINLDFFCVCVYVVDLKTKRNRKTHMNSVGTSTDICVTFPHMTTGYKMRIVKRYILSNIDGKRLILYIFPHKEQIFFY